MFDIGFIEMLVIGLILLLVVGPERLPEVARTLGGWVHQAKSYVDSMKSEIDRDLQLSELDQQTRRATETERSLEPKDKGSGDQAHDQADADDGTGSESGAGEGGSEGTGSGGTEPEKAGVSGDPAGTSEPAGDGETAGDSGPDPEDQAASDMERELEEDDEDKRDEDRRG